jgi:tetratricopeptide (TPR) repeat protein
MERERYRRLKEVFLAACEKEGRARAQYLDDACAGDPGLRERAEALLRNDEGASRLFRAPALEDRALPSELPARIGRYRILSLLGEGGMGVVYLAQQDRPERTVALKVMKPGLASEERLRRFEREAEALGRLQHPGIAQIFEAGTADTGSGPRPFLAMEHVRGSSLLEHARDLGIRARLELLARICDSVAHAHQKGVMHRDLKPGNILVDEAGQPKVLDFGLARATDVDLETVSMRTGEGAVLGTLPYMSPEQLSGDPAEVDTRTDVYSLGVVAYELLSGRLPHELRHKPIPEAARIVREEDPAPISAIDPALRGDAATIVAKALEKEKSRRYQSVADLGADLRRFLRDEPIQARPPSALYQLRKFAKRNRALVAGVSAALVALVAGIIGTTWQAVRATEERNRSVLAQQSAEVQARRSKEVQEFLQGMLRSLDPGRDGRDVKVIDVLAKAARRIDGAFPDEPLVEAPLRTAIGLSFKDLGLYSEAEPHLRRALELLRLHLGEDDPETDTARNNLAVLLQNLGKLPEAEVLLRGAVESYRERLGPEDPTTLVMTGNLAQLLQAHGQEAEALILMEKTLEAQRRILGSSHASTLDTMINLGGLYQGLGRLPEAEALLLEAVDALARERGPDHPRTLIARGNLASVYYGQVKLEAAERALRENLPELRRVLGPEHGEALTAAYNLALVLDARNEKEEAATLLREVLAARERVYGDETPLTLETMRTLALVLVELGLLAEAEALQRRELEIERRVLGADHPDMLRTVHELGQTLRDQDSLVEAEQLLLEACEGRERLNGLDHPDTQASIRLLDEVMQAKPVEAGSSSGGR